MPLIQDVGTVLLACMANLRGSTLQDLIVCRCYVRAHIFGRHELLELKSQEQLYISRCTEAAAAGDQ